jgi:Ca2+-transporting ATPase
MNRLPRNPAAPLLDRPSVVFITTSGALKAALALALLGALWIAGESVPMARSAVFAFLAVGQLFYTYPARRSELAPPPNPWVHWAVAVSLALQLLVLAVPPLQAAFDVVPMEVTAVLLVMGAAGLAWVGAEIVARYSWRTPAR